MTSSPPKTPPPNTISLRVRFQHEFWEDTNMQSAADLETGVHVSLYRESRQDSMPKCSTAANHVGELGLLCKDGGLMLSLCSKQGRALCLWWQIIKVQESQLA